MTLTSQEHNASFTRQQPCPCPERSVGSHSSSLFDAHEAFELLDNPPNHGKRATTVHRFRVGREAASTINKRIEEAFSGTMPSSSGAELNESNRVSNMAGAFHSIEEEFVEGAERWYSDLHRVVLRAAKFLDAEVGFAEEESAAFTVRGFAASTA